MENVITLGKLLSQLFCFLLVFENSNLLAYIQKNTKNEIVLPVMGTIFLVM